MHKIEKKIVSYQVKPETVLTAVSLVKKSLETRPDELTGRTRKIKAPSGSIFVTLNRLPDGTPFEVFLNSKNSEVQDWLKSLSLMLTCLLREGASIEHLLQEMGQVTSSKQGVFVKKRFISSDVAAVGLALGEMLSESFQGSIQEQTIEADQETNDSGLNSPESAMSGMRECKVCKAFAVTRRDGCDVCLDCGDSKCS